MVPKWRHKSSPKTLTHLPFFFPGLFGAESSHFYRRRPRLCGGSDCSFSNTLSSYTLGSCLLYGFLVAFSIAQIGGSNVVVWGGANAASCAASVVGPRASSGGGVRISAVAVDPLFSLRSSLNPRNIPTGTMCWAAVGL